VNKHRIKIRSDQAIVTNAHIIYVADDGTETDISNVVQRVDVHLEFGSVARATLHVIMVDADVEAADILVREFRRDTTIVDHGPPPPPPKPARPTRE
jgi:S1-C subfamily serine protease